MKKIFICILFSLLPAIVSAASVSRVCDSVAVDTFATRLHDYYSQQAAIFENLALNFDKGALEMKKIKQRKLAREYANAAKQCREAAQELREATNVGSSSYVVTNNDSSDPLIRNSNHLLFNADHIKAEAIRAATEGNQDLANGLTLQAEGIRRQAESVRRQAESVRLQADNVRRQAQQIRQQALADSSLSRVVRIEKDGRIIVNGVTVYPELSPALGYSQSIDRYDFSCFSSIDGVQKIFLPRAGLNSQAMWSLLKTNNFLQALEGADDFLLLVLSSPSAMQLATTCQSDICTDLNYKCLFEVRTSTDSGNNVAYVRRKEGQANTYAELILMGKMGFPDKQMVLQVTGNLTQEQIDKFVVDYFNK